MMYELPIKLEVGGVYYQIREKGDYRMVLDTFSALSDEELQPNERIMCALIIFYEDFNDIEDLQGHDLEALTKAMYKWFEAGKPESVTANNLKLMDWEIDSAIICAAVNKVAGFEIRAKEYIHWWTFMGYFMGIGEGTFSTVVSIRSKISKGKKLEKWEQEFKQENPQYFNWNLQEDAEAEAWFNEVWNKE